MLLPAILLTICALLMGWLHLWVGRYGDSSILEKLAAVIVVVLAVWEWWAYITQQRA